MDESNSTHKFIAFVLVAAALLGAAFVFFVGMTAWNSFQEVKRRDECVNNLRKLDLALENYSVRANDYHPSFALDEFKSPSENTAPHSPSETKLPFDTYGGYFVSNKYEPEAAESFAVIDDRERFDKIFGVAMVMGDKSRRLPDDAFKSNVVLAAIKRGRAFWEFKVESVVENEGVISLRYTTSSKKSDSAAFACPLIVSIPKGKYSAIQFIENGKPAKTIKLEGGNKDRQEGNK